MTIYRGWILCGVIEIAAGVTLVLTTEYTGLEILGSLFMQLGVLFIGAGFLTPLFEPRREEAAQEHRERVERFAAVRDAYGEEPKLLCTAHGEFFCVCRED